MFLKIGKEDYKIKFSTRLYTDDDILDKVQSLSNRDDEGIANIKPFLDCVVGLVLAGLQKDSEHTQYHYDIENPADKKAKRSLVFDLLDDYIDDGGDVFELFEQLNDELQNRGFLGNLKNREEQAKEKIVATK